METGFSDDELIARVLSGDREAFSALFERYKHYVAKILTKYLPSSDVEDGLIEVFERAYRRLESYDARAPFRHWLATIAVRRSYDILKARKHRGEVFAPPLDETQSEWLDRNLTEEAQAKFDADEEQKLASKVLRWALSKLSAEDRMVLTLVYFEEKSYREASALLGWSEVSMRMRALRARRALKTILTKRGEGL